MTSLRDHFERTKAKKQAQAMAHDPRLSAQHRMPPLARPLGQTLTRQTMAEIDGIDESLDDDNPDANSGIELKFFNDWEQLSNIQSHHRKNELKAEFLPFYKPWVEGTIASGVGTQNDMLLKLMVWSLDTQDFATATDIAEFALLHDMVIPEPFSRSVATLFAEQMADEIIKNDGNIDKDTLHHAIDITNPHDMPDPVRAKLYRAYGNILKDKNVDDAISYYEKALKLDSQVGCKTDLNQLKKQQSSD